MLKAMFGLVIINNNNNNLWSSCAFLYIPLLTSTCSIQMTHAGAMMVMCGVLMLR